MTRDQSDYDFLVSEYGKTQNRIRDLEEENKELKHTLKLRDAQIKRWRDRYAGMPSDRAWGK